MRIIASCWLGGIVLWIVGSLVSGCMHHKTPTIPTLKNTDEIAHWLTHNLSYKNVHPWDPAPPLHSIIKNGYGDCKMISGVVSELLTSAGITNNIVVIQKKSWHMFNVYINQHGHLKVINNGIFWKETFSNHDEIKKRFNVTHYVNVFESYSDFRMWFNRVFFPNNRSLI
jgi:hypothetical protein